MKPLEHDVRHALSRFLVEDMVRLWKSHYPDANSEELRRRFWFEVELSQMVYIYGQHHELLGFATWWRVDGVFERAVVDLGVNHMPLSDPRVVAVRNPTRIVLNFLSVAKGHPWLVRALCKAVMKANPDCKQYSYTKQKTGRVFTVKPAEAGGGGVA